MGKMNKLKRILFTLIICYSGKLSATSAVLVTYLKQPSIEILNANQNKIDSAKIVSTLNNYISTRPPSKIAKKILHGKLRQDMLPKIGGFPALYAGFLDYSNKDGLISFPLRHTSPKLYIVITKKIKLEMIEKDTVSHLELTDPAATKIYLFEKKQDENKQYYWDVTEQQKPEDNRVNPISMVILSNPANLYVQTGDFMATENSNLILPNIFVVGAFEKEKIILDSMNFFNNFESIETVQKAHKKKKQILITNS